MTFRIEAGKRYVTRNGGTTSVVTSIPGGHWPFAVRLTSSNMFMTYREDGSCASFPEETTKYDLIEEYIEPAPERQGATAIDTAATGIRLDSGKPRWSLLPFDALTEVVNVFTFGAKKYTDNNWRQPGIKWGQHHSAAMRHLAAFWEGEEREGESKLYHLAHACCDILMLLTSSMLGLGTDDRPKKGPK